MSAVDSVSTSGVLLTTMRAPGTCRHVDRVITRPDIGNHTKFGCAAEKVFVDVAAD